MIVLAAFVAAVLTALVLWVALRPVLDGDLFARENVRGRRVPTAGGVVVVLTAVGLEAAFTLLTEMTGLRSLRDGSGIRSLTLLLVVGLGLLGLLDDLAGSGADGRGFAGHLRALAEGRLTTGGAKLLGGAAVALVAVGPLPGGTRRLVADAVLVALAANLGNLLDRAPGRATKAGLLAFAALLVAVGLPGELAGVAVVAGACAGLLAADLGERVMLGDTGANALGAALGFGLVATASPASRTVALVVVAALNLASEVVSFSRVIEAFPPLRALDRLGRRP